jgi:trimethylamine--corrinoid protein Co-methyltransferase
LALEAIAQVGPGGNYLAAEHTVANFRQELWFPRLFDRKIWSVWEGEGSQDIAARASQKVASAKQNVPPLEDAVSKEILDIVAQADRRYGS